MTCLYNYSVCFITPNDRLLALLTQFLLFPNGINKFMGLRAILIDRRRHSSIIDVRSFRGADCDTDYYLEVAKLGKDWQ